MRPERGSRLRGAGRSPAEKYKGKRAFSSLILQKKTRPFWAILHTNENLRILHSIPSQVCQRRGEGRHRSQWGGRGRGLQWGALTAFHRESRVPPQLGDVSRRSASVLGLDPPKSSSQQLRPASKGTHASARGMPPLSQLGHYLGMHAPRGR